MTTRLKPRGRETLRWILNFVLTVGGSPTHREIIKAMGFRSTSTSAYWVKKFVKMGYLKKRGSRICLGDPFLPLATKSSTLLDDIGMKPCPN